MLSLAPPLSAPVKQHISICGCSEMASIVIVLEKQNIGFFKRFAKLSESKVDHMLIDVTRKATLHHLQDAI